MLLVIHGPNLNLLGQRETDVYGTQTLEAINQSLHELADEYNKKLQIEQSNHEGEIIDLIHQAPDQGVEAIIINIKNIKMTLSHLFTLLVSQLRELSYFFENLSFLRAQKVLKFEFAVEAIIIFVKNIKKKASSGIFTLLVSQ
mgnify:CR=1 FL=1